MEADALVATRLEALQKATRAYATARLHLDTVDARIERDVKASPEWAALQAAQVAQLRAEEALVAFQAAHPQQTLVKEAAMHCDAAKQALLAAWREAAKHEPKKTWACPEGEVQFRVTAGVHVTNLQLLAEDLLKRGLFQAAVKDVKVDAKLLRPLVATAGIQGLEVQDAVAVAWKPGGA